MSVLKPTPEEAWANFRTEITQQGGTVLENTWLGSGVPHRVLCGAGHSSTPKPNNVRSGHRICRVCVVRDKAWNLFRDRVQRLGSTVVELEWLGNQRPHRAICKYGHEIMLVPQTIRKGGKACSICSNRVWSTFYVVVNPKKRCVKFGVTSRDARWRISEHRRSGFSEEKLIVQDLPNARKIEGVIQKALSDAGMKPIRGKEYFDTAALGVIMDIANGYIT